MEGAATGARTQQRAHHRLGQHIDGFANAGRSRALRSVHGQKRLHQGHGNLAGFERHHRAIAPDDVERIEGRGRSRRRGDHTLEVGGDGVCADIDSLHGWPFLLNLLMRKIVWSFEPRRWAGHRIDTNESNNAVWAADGKTLVLQRPQAAQQAGKNDGMRRRDSHRRSPDQGGLQVPRWAGRRLARTDPLTPREIDSLRAWASAALGMHTLYLWLERPSSTTDSVSAEK